MSDIYDVIIVGGGYAGLCCALRLRGRKVLLLEAKKQIARKHRGCQCGLYALGETFRVDGNDLYFEKNNINITGAVKALLNRVELESNGHTIVISLKNPMPIVDEARLKGALEQLCREAGVEIVTGARATSIETDGNIVNVVAERKYQAKFLVGADGAHSRVIHYVPVKRKKIGQLLELDVETEGLHIQDNTMYAEMKGIKTGFFAQPYGSHYMIGVFQALGSNDNRIDIHSFMEEALKKLGSGQILYQYGCHLPVHLSASASYYKNIILAGDVVSSFSMSTITGAMMMGMLAGEAIIERMDGKQDPFSFYDKQWRKLLQQSSMDSMKYLFFLFRRLNEKRLGKLFAALEGSDLGIAGAGYYLRRLPGIVGAFL